MSEAAKKKKPLYIEPRRVGRDARPGTKRPRSAGYLALADDKDVQPATKHVRYTASMLVVDLCSDDDDDDDYDDDDEENGDEDDDNNDKNDDDNDDHDDDNNDDDNDADTEVDLCRHGGTRPRLCGPSTLRLSISQS